MTYDVLRSKMIKDHYLLKTNVLRLISDFRFLISDL